MSEKPGALEQKRHSNIDPSALEPSAPRQALAWVVLVVEGGEGEREASRLALERAWVLGRPVEVVMASGAERGLELARSRGDIALALIGGELGAARAGRELAAAMRAMPLLRGMRIIASRPKTPDETEEGFYDAQISDPVGSEEWMRAVAAELGASEQMIRLRRSQASLSQAAEGAAELMACAGSEAEVSLAAGRLARRLFGERSRLALIDQRDGAALGLTVEEGLRAGAGLSPSERMMEILSRARGAEPPAAPGALEASAELSVQGGRATLWLEPESPFDEIGLSVFGVYAASVGSALSVAKMRESMRAAAYEDGLTLLPNRSKLIMDIDSMRSGERQGLCLLFIDIEGFSGVNDALGYDAGDALLIRLAMLLSETYPEARLFRMPGGAFALLAERGGLDHLKALALFEEPIHAAEWEFPVKATLGMSYLDAQKSARQTLNESNMALNSAKKAGVSFLEHDSRISRSGQERLRLTRDLKRSLSSETGLKLFYQPQLSMKGPSLVGAEALCRWFQPDGSMIPPNRFIPVAEATGLIMPLGRWALFEVGKQAAAWERAGLAIRVGVNVAPAQLMDPKFCHQLRQMLEETGARADLIEIEITESAAMRDPKEVSARLKEARALGFRVSIDDFGSGYSSLAQLERMPIDRLKMDRAFVSPLAEGHRSLNIARMVARLAEELGMDVIAEGVETEEQARLLQSVGVSQAQGWLYAPALAPEAFEKWARDLRSRPGA